jgi:Holliday junction resolvase RusA-like endonuclease
MTAELVVRVHGTPARQGSKSFKGMRGKHAVMVEADDNLPAWRKAVIAAAENAKIATGWLMLNEAVDLTAWVYLRRPKTVTRAYPTGRQDGDEDKYLRAIQDALSMAGVYYDDSLVVDGHIHKRYADGRPPGATIRISPMSEQGALI